MWDVGNGWERGMDGSGAGGRGQSTGGCFWAMGRPNPPSILSRGLPARLWFRLKCFINVNVIVIVTCCCNCGPGARVTAAYVHGGKMQGTTARR